MKKKILYTVYSVIFVGACAVPAILTPFMQKDGKSLENRRLSEFPKITTEEGKLNFEFFDQFGTYFSEHFGFRQNMVTLDGKVRDEMFGTSSDDDVIVGKDGWLFYAPTANDFMNINTLSKHGANNIVHNLLMFEKFCESKNAYFIFTIAPNKNSVYPEYMPFNYIETSGNGNYEMFLEAYKPIDDEWKFAAFSSQMQDELPPHFHFIDLRESLRIKKEKSDVPIYHKTDTHWNNLGALAARNTLIGGIDDSKYFLTDRNWYAQLDWSGDLAEMLYPSDVPMDNQFYCDYKFNYSYVGPFHGLDDITIKTTCEGKEGNLLMYRDSYGEAILPFMAESFGTAEFSRAVPYTTYQMTDGSVVIMEIVERNLGNLQKYAPVMPAPEADEDISGGKICKPVQTDISESGGFTHICGVISDEDSVGDSARIFVTVGGKSYEAFNCFEDKILGREGEINDNGFSLYIPKTEVLPTAEELTITIK